MYLVFSLAQTHAHSETSAIEVNNHFICTSAFPKDSGMENQNQMDEQRSLILDVSVHSGSSINSLFVAEAMNNMKRCKFFAIDPLCPSITVLIG